MEKELLQIGQAARLLSCHPHTLYRWEQEGKIKVYKNNFGVRYFRREDIQRLLESRKPKKSN